jgi:mRNA interferase RelE/StbE
MYKINWDERALSELRKLEGLVASRIYKRINQMREDIFSGDVKRLKGTNDFRLRVGNFRVIFSVEKDTITIWKVGNRKNIYKKLR